MAELVLARPGITREAEKHWSQALPLGLGYLAASARANGIDVSVVDGKAERHSLIGDTVRAILARHPAVVGLSALTVEYPAAVQIAQALKIVSDAPATVLGGVHANALPRDALSEAPALDYVIAGEAETALVEVVKNLLAGQSPAPLSGLYARDGKGGISGDGRAGWEGDLSSLPFPAWDLFPRVDTYPLMTERGCPFNCVFCSRNLTQHVRARPVGHVIEEIQWLHQDFGAREIDIEDETFGLNPDRADDLLGRIAEFNRTAGIQFKAQTRVDCVTRSLMRRMRKAGFKFLELGIESGDQEVIKQAQKGITITQVEEAVKVAREEGIKIWANFVLGLPGETDASIKHSIELATRINPDRLSVAIIVAYPGSQIYRWALAGEKGYRLLTRDWSQFDKYLSRSVELDNLKYKKLRSYEIQMYLHVYLRNLRVGALTRMVWKNRSFFSTMSRTILNDMIGRD